MASEQMTGVNPNILKWAREFLGYDLEVASKNITTPKRLRMMESGEIAPTYHQLVKLANKYERPAALFFFPEPPDETPPRTKFRTLPDFELDKLPPIVLKKVQLATLRQESLKELTNGVNPAKRRIINDILVDASRSAKLAAREVRRYVGVSVDAQASWQTPTAALREWRKIIEEVGIFVFKDAFKVDGVDGFCLYDKIFPIIFLNNSRAHTRQIFTLIHELAHLLLKNNGVTLPDIGYIDALSPAERRVERFCNQFAAEFLMPQTEFATYYRSLEVDPFERIAACSRHFSVSKEAAVIRTANLSLIEQQTVNQILALIRTQQEEIVERKKLESTSQGNYYNNVMHYLGDAFIDLVFGEYYRGRVDLYEVADHLGESPKNVSEIESLYLARA